MKTSKWQKAFTSLMLVANLLQLASCGNGRNNQNATVNSYGVNGIPATLDQKVAAVLNTFRCADGAAHQLSVLRFNSKVPLSQGTRLTYPSALNDNTSVVQTAVGVNSNKDVVVVKDYGSTMDTYLYLCRSQYMPSSIVVTSGQLNASLLTRTVNQNCYVTQVARLDMALAVGAMVFYAFTSIDAFGTVPNVCAPINNNQYGYNYGYNYNYGF